VVPTPDDGAELYRDLLGDAEIVGGASGCPLG
jgi:hypothetical protein